MFSLIRPRLDNNPQTRCEIKMIEHINKIKEKYIFLSQFMKFATVGVVNITIDFTVLNLLMYLTGEASGICYSIFKSISFLAAVINSYFMNKYWTFGSSGQIKTEEFLKFISVNLIGLGINVSIASYVVNTISIPSNFSPILWANIGAISAIVITLFWNFFGMKFFVFKK